MIVDGKLLLGIFLLFSGLMIFKFPDILQYALAAVLVVSGASAIFSSLRSRSSGNGGPAAQFRRVDEEQK
ncbi:MAG: hypothetical protein OSB09_03785 [Planctomycetota bacterium]|nr:hypothetical protein [Planctomycetota bacterium]